MTAVFRKSVQTKRTKKDTMGRIINLYAADSQLIFQGIQLFMPGLVAPLQLAGAKERKRRSMNIMILIE